ncbi:MAG: HYR domain-containing protein, partial [Bacteroidetes bacterium]|nr:HYR domain-containing protein [Bacteroidota bacterium]
MRKQLQSFCNSSWKGLLGTCLMVLAMLFTTGASAQCADDNVQFGTSTLTCDGVPVTLTTCIFGGEYRAVNVLAGNEYTFSTCGDSDFDTMITVYDSGGSVLASNDDFCGLQSQVTFIATSTEQIRVLIDEFFCADNTTCMTLVGSCVPSIIGDPPVITCPMDITLTASPNTCGAVVGFTPPLVTDTEDDPDPVAVQTAGPASGSEFPVGVTTVEFSATDSDGNTVTCSFNVTITDDEAPMAVCQDITVQLDASGQYVMVASEIDGGSTDNCAIASIAVG